MPAPTATPEPNGAPAPSHRLTAPPSYRSNVGPVIAALWLAAIVYVVALSWLLVGDRTRVVIRGSVVEQIIFLLLWGAATPAIMWSAARLPIDRRHWRERIAAHFGLAVVFIAALNVVAPALAWLVLGGASPFLDVLRRGRSEFLVSAHLALIVYAFILGAGHYLRTLDIRREEQLRAERLRADLASAQLRALTLQLQPHFLFNALNAVGALIVTGRNKEAFDVVGRLGELLRALLAIERREEVSLREELELAESYVGIERARLGQRLRVTWDVAQDVASAQLPPMLLQPIVENAIRHGVARSPGGGCLTIAARRQDTRLVLDVCDDGPGPAPAPEADANSGGVGLDNTRRRLAHLYGDASRLELTREGAVTRTRVELPFHVLANVTSRVADGAAA